MGQCLVKSHKERTQSTALGTFPDHYSESRICDWIVDQLPSRLLGEGIHLLRGGPGPIVLGWTHELLNDAGVHSFQDRELLLKTRDDIVAAVERHRQRLRLAQPPTHPACSPISTHCQSRPDCTPRTPEPGKGSSSSNPRDSSSSTHPNDSPTESSTGDSPAPVWAAGGVSNVATPCLDKDAVRQAMEVAATAAATAAAEATAKATAFISDGDGDNKTFRLVADWLPAGVRLYRISEEIRRMASSGNLEPSVHNRSAGMLDVSPTAVASAAAAVGGSGGALFESRSKSRFYSSSGISNGGDAMEAEREQDNGTTTTAAVAAALGDDNDDGASDHDVDVIVEAVEVMMMAQSSPCSSDHLGPVRPTNDLQYQTLPSITDTESISTKLNHIPLLPPQQLEQQQQPDNIVSYRCNSVGVGDVSCTSFGCRIRERSHGSECLVALAALQGGLPASFPSPHPVGMLLPDITCAVSRVAGDEGEGEGGGGDLPVPSPHVQQWTISARVPSSNSRRRCSSGSGSASASASASASGSGSGSGSGIEEEERNPTVPHLPTTLASSVSSGKS